MQAIMEELDIAGFVILHNAPGELETWTRIAPSYSVARFEQEKGGLAIRFRAMLADFKGDADKQKACIEATLSMLSGFGEIASVNAMRFLETVEAVREHFPGITQTPLHRTDEGETP
jgi:hypothetical protein